MPHAGSAARSGTISVPAAPALEGASRGESRLTARFGQELLGAGYTVTPNLLLRYASQLQISGGELLLIQYILQHWWDDQKPHPSVPALAREMGKSERMVRYYLQGLRDKGYLNLEARNGRAGERVSNSFDFAPLFQALRMIADQRACSPLHGDPATNCSLPLQLVAADQEPVRPEIQPRLRFDRSTGGAAIDNDTEQGPRAAPVVAAPPIPSEKTADPIAAALAAIGLEFGDEAHPRVSARRAENLRLRGALRVDQFLEAIDEARKVTLAHRSAVVRRRHSSSGDLGRKNLMPYFFATLEGLTEPEEAVAQPQLLVQGHAAHFDHSLSRSTEAMLHHEADQSKLPSGASTHVRQDLTPGPNRMEEPTLKGDSTHVQQVSTSVPTRMEIHSPEEDSTLVRQGLTPMCAREAATPNSMDSIFPKGKSNPLSNSEALWQAVLAELHATLAAEAFRRWLAPTRVLGGDNATLEIAVRDITQQHWLAQRLRPRIEEALCAAGGAGVQLCYIVSNGV